ncbi:MAG: RpiB/LacA/LacB family sugar-phosphate isomerase [Phycisphaerales bacterium]
MPTIALAADHAGRPLLGIAQEAIESRGDTLLLLGAELSGPGDDYPDFAQLVARSIQAGAAARGILICGSGVGAAVAASKFRGVRAGVCHDAYSAAQSVEHDDLNVLCLGARIVGPALARVLLDRFLTAEFSGEARHVRRLAKVRAFEENSAE